MCIGIPMRVLELGAQTALCEGQGEVVRVGTRLIDEVKVGEWVLVFMGDARSIIDEQRAQEIAATLDMVSSAMHGQAPGQEISFALPSQLSVNDLHALLGGGS